MPGTVYQAELAVIVFRLSKTVTVKRIGVSNIFSSFFNASGEAMKHRLPITLALDLHKTMGLVAGIAVFFLMLLLPAPSQVGDTGWSVTALAGLMAIWWMTEAVPLAATALAPIVVLPILGVDQLDNVAQSYAHPLIFLFLGGFIIAKALERWNLHAKIATALIQLAPRSAEGLIGAMMGATAFLSMWISNTATALVMVSIAQSISKGIGVGPTGAISSRQSSQNQFSAAMMLGVAFSATVGGMATIIGTPPNALLVAYLQESHGISISFVQWMGIGLPLVIVLLPVTWILLTRIVFNTSVIDLDSMNYKPLSTDSTPLPAGAKMVALIAMIAALTLIFRPVLQRVVPDVGISDAGILMAAALILLILPAPNTKGEPLLDWRSAVKIPWDVLILFGGGLALANALEQTGLAQSIGPLFSAIDVLPVTIVILLAMITMVLIGELASNTAMVAVFLPVVGTLAVSMGIPPLELLIPIGLAASIGFMLPVATPPNAIAFGSGEFTSGQLLRAGALLDVFSIVIVFIIAVYLGPVVFHR